MNWFNTELVKCFLPRPSKKMLRSQYDKSWLVQGVNGLIHHTSTLDPFPLWSLCSFLPFARTFLRPVAVLCCECAYLPAGLGSAPLSSFTLTFLMTSQSHS